MQHFFRSNKFWFFVVRNRFILTNYSQDDSSLKASAKSEQARASLKQSEELVSVLKVELAELITFSEKLKDDYERMA
jgi:hypothetical protein